MPSPRRHSLMPTVYVSPYAHCESFVASAGMTRVPGILAGLNDRSQSAYAMPAPKPEPSAIGHALPTHKQLRGMDEEDEE